MAKNVGRDSGRPQLVIGEERDRFHASDQIGPEGFGRGGAGKSARHADDRDVGGLAVRYVIPRSTTSACPVMKPAADDSRNNAAAAISSAVPNRPSGVLRTNVRSWRSVNPATISLWKYPGASELTRMLLGPSSRARARVNPSRAALVAL